MNSTHAAKVAISEAAYGYDTEYTYKYPEILAPVLKPGMRVLVPFGKGNSKRIGLVTRTYVKPEPDERLKPIISIVDKEPLVNDELLNMVFWLKEHTFCTFFEAFRTIVPAGYSVVRQSVYEISNHLPDEELSEEEEALLTALKGASSRREFDEIIDCGVDKSKEAVVKSLVEKGVLEESDKFKRRVGDETVRMIRLTPDYLENNQKGFTVKQKQVVDFLTENETASVKETCYYLSVTPTIITNMVKKGVLEEYRYEALRTPQRHQGKPAPEISLSEEQTKAYEGVKSLIDAHKPAGALLYGVTGSGKTEVYMELIAHVLAQGKQAIVLIPEIALTYQNVERFCARFGTRVTVVNSRMTPSERADQMERARRGEVSIMIGPRSALFAPFPELGLIVIDEEHETSYKSEVTPRYHARETAVRRAGLEHAHVVMGSATPSVDASYACETGAYALFRMDARYGNAALPSVWIADMREELQMGNRSILSGKLREEIEKRLEKKEQVVLFLNRRGYAGFVSCRACGHVMKCPHCDVSLTAHNNGKLACHYCGYETPQVHACPSCGSPYIGGFRAGTQQIEQNVKKLFPKARVLRMDGDTTKTKNSYEEILSSFAAGGAGILIGTQMIVKGHDFPNVTLVGALAADLSLNAVDYRAGERTFQLLTQAVGRAGRGEKPGMAVIQTYHPEHYSIQTAAEQDYGTFYEKEMDYRRLMGYPPAAELLAIHGAGEDEAHLTQAMEYIRRYLIRIRGNREVQIIGPASEAVSKINDLYRMAVYVRAPQEEVLAELREKLERYIEINKGFRTVYLQFDFSRKY